MNRRKPYLTAFGIGLLLTLLTSMATDILLAHGTGFSSKTIYMGQPLTILTFARTTQNGNQASSWRFSILALAFDMVFWSAFGLMISGAYWKYRKAKQSESGLCTSCGYNLTGNESGICPECGEPVPREFKRDR